MPYEFYFSVESFEEALLVAFIYRSFSIICLFWSDINVELEIHAYTYSLFVDTYACVLLIF